MMSAGPLTIERCLQAESSNGLGFPSHGTGMIQLGGIGLVDESASDLRSEEELQQWIIDISGAASAVVSDSLGRTALSVHYRDWARIPAIFRMLLDAGFYVSMRGNLCVVFKGAEEFSFEAAEEKLVTFLRECRGYQRSWHEVFVVERATHVYLKHYNWRTAAGKQLCTEMRAEMRPRKPIFRKLDRFGWPDYDRLCREHGVLHHGGWSAYEPLGLASPQMAVIGSVSAAAPLSPAKKQKTIEPAAEEAAADEDQCMICLDAAPTTVVLPCLHKVVCESCSRALQRTNDAHTCVRCRRKIDGVLYDAK